MIQILGLSKAKIVILYDLLNELYQLSSLDIFLNIDLELEIPFYTMEFPVTIHSPIDLPDVQLPCVLGIFGSSNKKAVVKSFETSPGITRDSYLKVIHPSAQIARSSILQPGCTIESLVSISSQSIVGFGVDIKRGAQIGHHDKIGDFCDINPGAILCGNVTIGNECTIGAGAILKDGISIGSQTIIGMGSVVTQDIPEGVIAYGNPCKIIKDNPVTNKFS